MIKAIVYTSNTGTTEEYAQLISQKTGLPYYSLFTAKTKLAAGSEIIYLGWIMAGKIKEFNAAQKLFKIVAMCGVGMAKTGTQDDDVIKANKFDSNVAIFTLQGGFNIKKLTGVYRFMMNTMSRTVSKRLARKAVLTDEDKEMLDMMQHGGNYVSEDNLKSFFEWYNTTKA